MTEEERKTMMRLTKTVLINMNEDLHTSLKRRDKEKQKLLKKLFKIEQNHIRKKTEWNQAREKMRQTILNLKQKAATYSKSDTTEESKLFQVEIDVLTKEVERLVLTRALAVKLLAQEEYTNMAIAILQDKSLIEYATDYFLGQELEGAVAILQRITEDNAKKEQVSCFKCSYGYWKSAGTYGDVVREEGGFCSYPHRYMAPAKDENMYNDNEYDKYREGPPPAACSYEKGACLSCVSGSWSDDAGGTCDYGLKGEYRGFTIEATEYEDGPPPAFCPKKRKEDRTCDKCAHGSWTEGQGAFCSYDHVQVHRTWSDTEDNYNLYQYGPVPDTCPHKGDNEK